MQPGIHPLFLLIAWNKRSPVGQGKANGNGSTNQCYVVKLTDEENV